MEKGCNVKNLPNINNSKMGVGWCSGYPQEVQFIVIFYTKHETWKEEGCN